MSGGTLNESIRKEWENRLFNNIYNKSKPFDRVKYGVLNVINDPNGVKCCSGYGDSYFLLQNTRLRTTFASKDTSAVDVKLATAEHYNHVLLSYSDKELNAGVGVAIGRAFCTSSAVIEQYKEVQIHGPLKLNTDIEAVVVNPKYKGNEKMEALIKKFADKNNCNVIWMEEADHPGIVRSTYVPPSGTGSILPGKSRGRKRWGW